MSSVQLLTKDGCKNTAIFIKTVKSGVFKIKFEGQINLCYYGIARNFAGYYLSRFHRFLEEWVGFVAFSIDEKW